MCEYISGCDHRPPTEHTGPLVMSHPHQRLHTHVEAEPLPPVGINAIHHSLLPIFVRLRIRLCLLFPIPSLLWFLQDFFFYHFAPPPPPAIITKNRLFFLFPPTCKFFYLKLPFTLSNCHENWHVD